MDQWTQISKRFHEWSAPLRPSPEDVQLFAKQVKPQERVLLLGVTSELMSLAEVAITPVTNKQKGREESRPFVSWSI